jgi:hypothetical protein
MPTARAHGVALRRGVATSSETPSSWTVVDNNIDNGTDVAAIALSGG